MDLEYCIGRKFKYGDLEHSIQRFQAMLDSNSPSPPGNISMLSGKDMGCNITFGKTDLSK